MGGVLTQFGIPVPFSLVSSFGKVKSGGLDAQGYPMLHSEIMATLGYVRLRLKKKRKVRRRKGREG